MGPSYVSVTPFAKLKAYSRGSPSVRQTKSEVTNVSTTLVGIGYRVDTTARAPLKKKARARLPDRRLQSAVPQPKSPTSVQRKSASAISLGESRLLFESNRTRRFGKLAIFPIRFFCGAKGCYDGRRGKMAQEDKLGSTSFKPSFYDFDLALLLLLLYATIPAIAITATPPAIPANSNP